MDNYVTCQCGKRLKTPANFTGTGKCPACGSSLVTAPPIHSQSAKPKVSPVPTNIPPTSPYPSALPTASLPAPQPQVSAPAQPPANDFGRHITIAVGGTMVFCLLLLWLGLRGSESEKKLVAEEKAQTAPAAGSDKESNIDKDYNQGMAALENGDYHSAISCFTLAIERQSEHVESYHGRASANLALGALDKAIADSTEAIRLKSDHAKAYGCRALAYGKKGDVDKAIADFTTSLRLELDAEKFLGRANAYIMKSEWKKVIEDTTQAIRLRPGYPDAYLMRGFACNKEGDYSQAITDMTEAIRLKPSPDSYYFRAIAHQANGDTAKATSDIEAGQKLQQQLTTERGKNGSLQNSYTKPTSDKEDSPFQPKTPAVQAAAPVRGDNDSSPPDNKDSSTIKIIELIVPFRQA